MTGLSAAITEAYATAQSNVVYLDTLEISNTDAGNLFLVQDRVDHVLGLETGASQLFTACGFRFSLPATGRTGLQTLTIAVDNVDNQPTLFIKTALSSNQPVIVTYRPYLSSDLTRPQMDPPLVLYLTDVKITAFEVTGTASFIDLLNRKFLTDTYTSLRFPAL